MKRFGHLYEKICSLDNIREAHRNARKGKRHYSEVKMVDSNSEYYFLLIQKMLQEKTFKNSKYTVFKRTFEGKERTIFKLPYFPDRIIHHCIMQVLGPIWKRTLIRDTYSSIKGRGIHDGYKRVIKALQDSKNTRYCLKLDIQKYFPSINHDILKKIIRSKVKCRDTLWLLDIIIDSASGVPIGNYLSQYFGNIYLSMLDHFIKEICHVKYYFRYCDDLVLLGEDKPSLHQIFRHIQEFCEKRLLLKIKSNYQVFPIEIRGLDFMGYRFFHKFTLARKSIVTRFKRKIRSIDFQAPFAKNAIMAYWGWFKYANCYNLIKKYFTSPLLEVNV